MYPPQRLRCLRWSESADTLYANDLVGCASSGIIRRASSFETQPCLRVVRRSRPARCPIVLGANIARYVLIKKLRAARAPGIAAMLPPASSQRRPVGPCALMTCIGRCITQQRIKGCAHVKIHSLVFMFAQVAARCDKFHLSAPSSLRHPKNCPMRDEPERGSDSKRDEPETGFRVQREMSLKTKL